MITKETVIGTAKNWQDIKEANQSKRKANRLSKKIKRMSKKAKRYLHQLEIIHNEIDDLDQIVKAKCTSEHIFITYNNGSSPCKFDLTLLFGECTARQVYLMEQQEPGSGEAWFESVFPGAYMRYMEDTKNDT